MACFHESQTDLNGSLVCLDCGLVLGIAAWGAPDYDHDEEDWVYKTPSPELSEHVPEKKQALVVDTVCRSKILRPTLSDTVFYVAQDLYSEFFTFKVKKRLKPMLVFDCLLYYVANAQGHYQFYEIWHHQRHERDLKHWHRCETILAQTLGATHRDLFEFKIHVKEAMVQLGQMMGLSGRLLMRAAKTPPVAVHDMFHEMIQSLCRFCGRECPYVLERPCGQFIQRLQKRHSSRATQTDEIRVG